MATSRRKRPNVSPERAHHRVKFNYGESCFEAEGEAELVHVQFLSFLNSFKDAEADTDNATKH